VLFGGLLAAFAFSRFMPLTVAVLFAAGFANALYLNLALTTVQLNCPDELRGRVLAVWNLTWVLTPLGGFLAGGTAQVAGATAAVAIGGTAVAIFAVLIYMRVAAIRGIGAAPAPG
jgi:hypothetical protein